MTQKSVNSSHINTNNNKDSLTSNNNEIKDNKCKKCQQINIISRARPVSKKNPSTKQPLPLGRNNMETSSSFTNGQTFDKAHIAGQENVDQIPGGRLKNSTLDRGNNVQQGLSSSTSEQNFVASQESMEQQPRNSGIQTTTTSEDNGEKKTREDTKPSNQIMSDRLSEMTITTQQDQQRRSRLGRLKKSISESFSLCNSSFNHHSPTFSGSNLKEEDCSSIAKGPTNSDVDNNKSDEVEEAVAASTSSSPKRTKTPQSRSGFQSVAVKREDEENSSGTTTAVMNRRRSKLSEMTSRFRSSKSLQNLEQLTRDGVYSLKEKYFLRKEFRNARPKSVYQILFDEPAFNDLDDEEAIRLRMLKMVGLT